MDDHTLKDLGLTGIAHTEAMRAFWDVPLDRLRAIKSLASRGLTAGLQSNPCPVRGQNREGSD
jgi:hypothetical protein